MSNDLIDSLLEQAKTLTEQERRLLASRLLEEPATSSNGGAEAEALSPDVKYRKREYQWIKEHQDEYAGQWVALEGDKLVASGSTAREALNGAKKAGARLPFIAKVDSPEDLYFTGGW